MAEGTAAPTAINRFLGEILTIGDEIREITFSGTRISQLKVRECTANELRLLKKKRGRSFVENKESIFTTIPSKYSRLPRNISHMKSETLFNEMRSIVEDLSLESSEDGGRARALMDRYTSLQEQVQRLKREVNTRDTSTYREEKLECIRDKEERDWEDQCSIKEKAIEEISCELECLIEEEQKLDQTLVTLNREKIASNYSMKVSNLKDLIDLRLQEKNDLQSTNETIKKSKISENQSTRTSSSGTTTTTTATTRFNTTTNKKNSSKQVETLMQQRDQLRNTIRNRETPVGNVEPNQDPTFQLLQNQIKTQTEILQKCQHSIQAIKATALRLIDKKANDKNLMALTLQVLHQNSGEMAMSTLKRQVAEVCSNSHVSNSSVIEAIYSLVANGCVNLDRTCAEGNVTLLVV